MTENDIFGVWLQQALGEGSRKVPALLEYFGSFRAVYEADELDLRLSGLLLSKEISRMETLPLDCASEILEACERLGYSVITPEDKTYPDRLRNIPDYPAALYICGELPDFDDEVCIAMVGTRRASRYGYTTATAISKDLAACGAIIISGCARGIDTAAHQGALLAGGRTVAVLGCGINERYNMENEGLRKVISTSGALISEYPPGSPALSYHFPVRNRIISALSLGVIVIEAGVKSGSLITAQTALEQGKDIFSVPGEIDSYFSKGTNRLIIDGAKPIENAGDVLEEYVAKFPHRIRSINLLDKNSRVYEKYVRPKWDKDLMESLSSAPVQPADTAADTPSGSRDEPLPSPKKAKPAENHAAKPREKKEKKRDGGKHNDANTESSPPIGMSEGAQRVWKALTDQPKHFQKLLEETGMDSSELSRHLTELELYGAVRAFPGSKYTKG